MPETKIISSAYSVVEIFTELLNEFGLDWRFRKEYLSDWEQVCSLLSYVPVEYSSNVIDYYMSYYAPTLSEIEDLSVILFHNNQPSGIWPLSASKIDGIWEIGSNGSLVMPPCFVMGLASKSAKVIIAKMQGVLDSFSEKFGCGFWESSISFSETSSISDWHDRILRRGGLCTLQYEMYLDLSRDLIEIKSAFRKSYKALINTGSRMWQIGVMVDEGRDVWDEFRQLHLFVSGRATRSLDSWDRQYHAICNGGAFLVYLRNEVGRMVGGGLFQITRDEGLYAVGVYDRNLFDKPLGHVVQYRAIEEMKRRGLRWYKLGARPYPSDHPTPSEKVLSIADFKQGFSSHTFPRYLIRYCLPEITAAKS